MSTMGWMAPRKSVSTSKASAAAAVSVSTPSLRKTRSRCLVLRCRPSTSRGLVQEQGAWSFLRPRAAARASSCRLVRPEDPGAGARPTRARAGPFDPPPPQSKNTPIQILHASSAGQLRPELGERLCVSIRLHQVWAEQIQAQHVLVREVALPRHPVHPYRYDACRLRAG